MWRDQVSGRGREESGSDEVICEREEGFSPGMGNPRKGVCAKGFGKSPSPSVNRSSLDLTPASKISI